MQIGEKKRILVRWEAVVAAFLLVLSMAVTMLPGMWVGAEDGDTQPGGDSLSNQIWVVPNEKIPVVFAGGSATEITIYYNSNITDLDAQITIGMPSGLYLRNTASTQKVEIHQNTDETSYTTHLPSFKVEADKDAASGIVPITITTVYKNSDKIQVTETMTYSVRIVNPEIPESSDTEEPSAPELIGNQITVSKNAFMPEIKAGETKNIQIPLNATSVVGSAQVTLTMPEGLYLESAAATQTVNFKKGSATINCRVTAKQDVTDSVASINIDSVYSYDNKQTTEKTTFSVRLRASDDIQSNGKLVITGYQLGSSTLSYNGDTSLVITVQNTGTANMKDITMTLDGMATGSVTLKTGMDVQTLVELGPGQQSTFTYQLHGDEALPSGTAILTATAACGEENSVAKVFVPCVGKPEETSGGEGESGPGSSKPQVIIESYTYGEEGVTSVIGGSTFTLGMTLRNTSASTAIENIKMVVSSAADETTGGVFTPASSSNSFFIAKVGAGETFSESIDLVVKADAPPKSYGIDVEISYDAVVDGTRQSLTATERITIPVSQPDRFEVEDAQISSTVYVGDSAYCSVSYVNKGKSAVYNLSIAVEGTGFTTADANTYVGNVEAGNGDYFETSLNVTEPGTIDGKFVITYEDSAGTQTTIERPFTATVMEMDWGEPDPMEPMEPVDVEPAMPLWGKILIIVGCVVVAGGIVVVVLRIRRKKRKAVPVFDDEDDDDYGDDDFDE